MALLPEVNGQKRVVLYGGIEKTRQVIQVHNVDEIMLMKITKHTSMFLQLEDMLSYNSTLQTTEAPADTVVVLDPDSMTWTPRKTSAVRLFLCIVNSNLETGKYVSNIFPHTEQFISCQESISCHGFLHHRGVLIWRTKHRNVMVHLT